MNDDEPLDSESYRALVEHAPTMLWRAGRDGRCAYFNATWLAFTGRALADELGDGWHAGIHPDDRDRYVARHAEAIARGSAFEAAYRLRRHDGVYRHVLARVVPQPGGGFIGTCVDVDDPRPRDVPGDAEFFEMSNDHLCVAGFDGYWKRLNPSWTRTLGWTTEELMARPIVDFAHPDDRARILAARGALKEGEALTAMANRYRHKDGSYRWFEWRSVSHVERGLVYAIARDVTAEIAAQRALQELTESLTTTLDSIAEGVIAIDRDGAITRMNPVAETLTGWTSAEARGRPLDQIFRVRVVGGDGHDHAFLDARDGTSRSIAYSRAPMRSDDGAVIGAVFVLRDLTAEDEAREVRTRLERQLVLADRLASVGTLAAGVAHEINNPLAYVTANLDMIIEELGRLAPGSLSAHTAQWIEMAAEARQGAERIRKIVRGLMTFSRAEEERRRVIDVKPVLELSINMAFNEIRHRARLVKDYGEVPRVDADESRLGQVVINLLVNAAQAIPEGDTDGNEIRIVTSTDAAGHAVIEVRDTGPGIPPHVIGRIFDPFFTTKPIGIGTGLGLSICHSLVTGMGGQITAHDRPGGGASFRVFLPAARADADAAAPSPRRQAPPAVRRRTVLVVDDDRSTGIAIGRLLRDHEVTVVTSAKEALELVAADRGFDVIVTDLMMPEMSGMELHDHLARRRPADAARMVFVTGGAFTPAAHDFLDRVANPRLEKPIDVAALRALVERVAG